MKETLYWKVYKLNIGDVVCHKGELEGLVNCLFGQRKITDTRIVNKKLQVKVEKQPNLWYLADHLVLIKSHDN